MTNVVLEDSRARRDEKPHLTKHGWPASRSTLVLVALGLTIWIGRDTVAFEASIQSVYDAVAPKVARANVARALDTAPRVADAKRLDSSQYGALLSQACTMCHGATLSGGPMPGMPSSVPIPSNLTPHPTGLKSWSYADFDRLLITRVRKNGKTLDPFMPTEAFAKYDDRQKRALWAYLRSIPARPFGQR